MAILRLEPPTHERFVDAPKLEMAIQIGRLPEGEAVLIISSQVSVSFDEETLAALASFPIINFPTRSQSVETSRMQSMRGFLYSNRPPRA